MKTIPMLASLVLAGCGSGVYSSGPMGPQGTNGQGCSVTALPISNSAPNGGSLITCPDGTSSVVLNGAVGTSGTVISPVQFCPRSTEYATGTFSEVGFCIDGKLYAVYSDHGGFMSVIPNGTYSSNGENSSCVFKVDGCNITRE